MVVVARLAHEVGEDMEEQPCLVGPLAPPRVRLESAERLRPGRGLVSVWHSLYPRTRGEVIK